VIDVILVLVLLAYAVSGFRQGLALSALSLGGFVLGALAAILAVPSIAGRLEAGPERSFAVLAAVLVLAWLGQLVGALIGGRLREQLPHGSARRVDQGLGAVAGLVAAALVMWFVGGAVRSVPAVAGAVGSSRVLQTIDAVMPQRAATLASRFRESVAASDFPRVFSGAGPEDITPVDPPSDTAVPPVVAARVKAATVKITGDAQECGRSQEGSGAVVAPGRVVTNAHVVAGVTRPQIQLGGTGRRYAAKVVLFDPQRDVAVLAVTGLPARAAALPLGADAGRGDDAAFAGYPRNGPYALGAARVRSVVRASGDDIYGRPGVVRRVYSLYATVEPGNSGGPVVDPKGSLVGVVFAKSLDDARTGYALTMGEVRGSIDAGIAARDAVDTGGCAAG
jgi:S1-C subfamily serine protease